MIDPEGLESAVDGNKIIVKGIDKEKVGQYAAEIRDKRRPEPYKGCLLYTSLQRAVRAENS